MDIEKYSIINFLKMPWHIQEQCSIFTVILTDIPLCLTKNKTKYCSWITAKTFITSTERRAAGRMEKLIIFPAFCLSKFANKLKNLVKACKTENALL